METSAHVSPEAVEDHEKETDEFNNKTESDSNDSFNDIKEIEYTSDSE